MRKTTFMWLALAVVASAVLFHTSQKVSDGRQHLANLQQNITTEEESIRVLQAEWSYLNQPERLEKLARQYLELTPMTGRQFAKAEDIPVAQVPLAAPEASPEKPVSASPVSAVPAPEVQKTEVVPAPVAAKQPAVKPAPLAKVDAPKIIKPASPPPVAQKTLPVKQPAPQQAATPAKAPVREASKDTRDASKDFNDLMKNLGVQ